MTAHGMGATLAHMVHGEQAARKATVSKDEKYKEVTGGTHTRIRKMSIARTSTSLCAQRFDERKLQLHDNSAPFLRLAPVFLRGRSRLRCGATRTTRRPAGAPATRRPRSPGAGHGPGRRPAGRAAQRTARLGEFAATRRAPAPGSRADPAAAGRHIPRSAAPPRARRRTGRGIDAPEAVQPLGRRVQTTVISPVTAPSARWILTDTGNSGRCPASSSATTSAAGRSRVAVAVTVPMASFL